MLLEVTQHTFTAPDHYYKPDHILPIGMLDADNAPKQVIVTLGMRRLATAITGAPPRQHPQQ